MSGAPKSLRSSSAGVVLAALWILALEGFALWSRRPLLKEGLWRDEAISVYVAAAPSAADFLLRNRTSDYTPPLFNAFLAGSMRLGGSDEAFLKGFAMALGLLALAAGSALAWRIGGPLAAAVAAAFLVNNPILIDMSAELRAYSLSAFLACAALFAAIGLRRRGEAAGGGGFVGLGVVLALLVYSHVGGGIVAGVLLLWGIFEWLRAPSGRFGRRLALSAAAAFAAFLFWMPTTWRQARIGVPWEEKLSTTEALRATAMRMDEALPIPGAFGQILFVLALVVLLVASVRLWPGLRDRLRAEREPLLLLGITAAAVWAVLGLYTRQSSRYLIIPAVLAAVVCACLLARVVETAWQARPGLRAAAVVALAALVVSAFLARADLYEGRFALAARPKSGFRSLCESRLVEPLGLAIIVPDYLAPTAWYYCGRDETIRGFVRWDRPFLFDGRHNRELWSDPAAARQAVSRIEETLRSDNRSRFTVVSEETSAGLLPLYSKPVDEFQAELARNYDARAVNRFPGRIEPVRAVVWSVR